MISDRVMLIHYLHVPAGLLEDGFDDVIVRASSVRGEERVIADVLEIVAWIRRNPDATPLELADLLERIGA